MYRENTCVSKAYSENIYIPEHYPPFLDTVNFFFVPSRIYSDLSELIGLMMEALMV